MAVAATFLTVSAGAALAQSSTKSAAELAIDAAIPFPEPANVPPPTAADIQMDSTPAAGTTDTKTVATKPASETKTETTASTTPAAPATAVTAPTSTPATEQATAPATEPAKAPVQTASKVAPADQPVADRLRELIETKASRYFDRKNERAAIEKFYAARDYAPLWTAAGALNASAKGVIARLNDAAADGLNPAEYPAPNFAAATGPDALAEADLKLTASMLDYARQAQSGQMHWSQVSADIQYPEHPVDPNEVLANVTTAKDASAALE
ncbi:MAG: murein L,D-transpeptidase, partial [Rhizobiales bacterium]|nr:murein L,D-transpeptidase [Hyphomicrobiales bacterium]